MAGALPAEEYREKLEWAGFQDVRVTVTKPHEVNLEAARREADLTEEDIAACRGLSASALITAIRP